MVKKLIMVLCFFVVVVTAGTAGPAQAGKPVMYLPVSLLPESNTVRVSWEPQEGVSEYTVERWEIEGTGHWHFDINEKMKPGDKNLKIGGTVLNPLEFVHRAGPGETVDFYDREVKPRHTYFYRVNGGIIGVVETKGRVSRKVEGGGEQRQSGREGRDNSADIRSERQKKYDQSTDYPERMAADLVMALPNWLIQVIGLYDPLELVFGVDLKDSHKIEDGPPVKKGDLIWNTFSREEFRVIGNYYTGVRDAIPVFMAVGVVVAGVLVLFNSTSPGAVITARGYILGIILCAVLIKLGPYLLGFFFDVNRAIVALCHSVAADEIRHSFLHTVYNRETRSLGAAFMALIGCLSIGVINFQFAVRKVFIAILVGILPIAMINAIFPSRRSALAVWVKEFTSYVFMPAGLAVGLSFFIHFLNSGGFWITLACLLFLPVINSLVRGSLGLSDAGFAAGVGSALGIGAIFSMGSMLSQGKKEKDSEVLGPSGGGPPGVPGVSGTAPGKGGIAGATLDGRDSGAAAGGGLPAGLGKGAPGIMGSLARGALGAGVAGSMAIAGSTVSGAMSGDALPGLEIGVNTGGAAASTLNKSGSNLKQFFSEVREKGFSGATGIVDGSLLMDPGVTASLATRALGDNTLGKAAGVVAASASRGARAISPLVAPEAKERLDRAYEVAAAPQSEQWQQPEGSRHAAALGGELEKVRQMQHFRNMFLRIKSSQHTGGSGGISGFTWR